MLEKLTHLLLASVVISIWVVVASAQTRDAGTCRGPIYGAKEVTKRAKMLQDPDFHAVYEAFGRGVHAHVSLEAVLCRSGRVTDIHVTKSVPPNVAEFVVGAVSLMRFTPAEMNWHTVSQKQQFEFSINEDGYDTPIDPGAATGRLVEQLDIVGNRRITAKQIMSRMQTKAGEDYNAEKVKQDFNAILSMGYFDKLKSRVITTEGVRGGVGVSFEVFELPLIAEVRFQGLKPRDQSAVINELIKQRVDVRKDRPLDPARLRKAETIIEQFFQSQGWINVKAEAVIESISATESKVVFKISGHNF